VNGVKTGGGAVGGDDQINDQDFSRQSFELGYDYTLDFQNVSHALHVGYHTEKIQEDLRRLTNGWGLISAPGGRVNVPIGPAGVPLFFQVDTYQSSFEGYPNSNINSQTRSENFEFNDTISWESFTFNLGLLISKDTLYGQGLKRNGDNVSGYELAVGHRYEMYTVDPMLQPRLGITWDANDRTTVFANYARYNPSASSLARAASWDRNSLGKVIRSYYGADGTYLASEQRGGSSGKMFQKDMDPRQIDEYLLGTSYEFTDQLTGRAHVRYREGRNFWEDTNNNARLRFEPPPGIPQELYIPLEENEFVGASSYVIAQLDDAYTDYWELNLEAEWRGDNYYVQGSYVYSDYSGNFDQDNTTDVNDANPFIGSSWIADGAGRQLWDFKDGTLRGDKPHQFKLYGFYELSWNAGVGAYFIYQSGQPWEAWDSDVYRHLTTSTNDTNRYAEPAGSRRSGSHTQLDLNYTQNFYLGSDDRYNIQLRADIFNVFDSQTGYNIEPRVHQSNFGEPRDWFNPRRIQLMASFVF
jgi:hypothetical protein